MKDNHFTSYNILYELWKMYAKYAWICENLSTEITGFIHIHYTSQKRIILQVMIICINDEKCMWNMHYCENIFQKK